MKHISSYSSTYLRTLSLSPDILSPEFSHTIANIVPPLLVKIFKFMVFRLQEKTFTGFYDYSPISPLPSRQAKRNYSFPPHSDFFFRKLSPSRKQVEETMKLYLIFQATSNQNGNKIMAVWKCIYLRNIRLLKLVKLRLCSIYVRY